MPDPGAIRVGFKIDTNVFLVIGDEEGVGEGRCAKRAGPDERGRFRDLLEVEFRELRLRKLTEPQ